MSRKIVSEKQRQLFEQLAEAGPLVFACGPKGISANIVGEFSVRVQNNEDLLCMGDGTNHVHINWERLKVAEIGEFHGEGVILFRDGDESLFRLYRPAGLFNKDIENSTGLLV